MMYPELARLINNIQRSNLMEDKDLVCRSVQEYYKILNQVGSIKQPPVAPVVTKFQDEGPHDEKPALRPATPLAKMNKSELISKCSLEGLMITGEETNNKLRELLR